MACRPAAIVAVVVVAAVDVAADVVAIVLRPAALVAVVAAAPLSVRGTVPMRARGGVNGGDDSGIVRVDARAASASCPTAQIDRGTEQLHTAVVAAVAALAAVVVD